MKVFPGTTSRETLWPRLGGGAAMLIAGRVTSAACGLIQVPFALAHLGNEAFGLWTALTGLLWSLGILDLGLGYALQNRLARLLASGREAEADVLLRRGARWLGFAAAGLLLAALPLAFVLPWADWLSATKPTLRAQTPMAIVVTLSSAAILLPLALSARLAAARQETWLTGLWTALGSVVSLLGILLAVRLDLPLAAFVAAAAALPLILYGGLALHLAMRTGRQRTPAAVATETSGIAGESVLFFLPQLGSVFIGVFVPMLVALFAGSAAVASYSVLQRLFGLLSQLNMLGLQPTWPAYTHAAIQGNAAAARRIYRMSMVVTFAGFVAPTLLLAFVARPILALWLHDHAPAVSLTLVWTIASWNALQCVGQPPAMVLNGLGRNASIAVLGWIGLVVSLILCAWLGPVWGAAGVVVALASPYVALNLPIVYWQARRALATIGLATSS